MWCAFKGKQLKPSVINFAAVQALLAKVPSDEKKNSQSHFWGKKSCVGDLDYACCRLLLLYSQLV